MSKWLRIKIGTEEECVNVDAISRIYPIHKLVVYELKDTKNLLSEEFNSKAERDARYRIVLKHLDMLIPTECNDKKEGL